MTPTPQTLTELSTVTRRQLAAPKVYGDGLKSAYRHREARQIFGLAFTAANLAAAERKRHGRPAEAEEKADAAQDALAHAYAAAAPDLPKLADLIDSDRETVSSFDGSRESLRPSRELIAAAGASLDAAHSGRSLIDAAAGSGDLLTAAAQSRGEAEKRRRQSVAAQLEDPTASPVPLPVGEAIGKAGIWPTDPLRQAILDTVCPDLTADDWHLAGEGTAKAIERRRAKAETALQVDPHAVTFAQILEADLLPTDAEQVEHNHAAAERMVCANPYGAKAEAASLRDPAWRTHQPTISPLYVNGELVPQAEGNPSQGEG